MIQIEQTGFIKVVADARYNETLGVHIIGPETTELIGDGVLVLTHEATGEAFTRTVHAHATLYVDMSVLRPKNWLLRIFRGVARRANSALVGASWWAA